MTKFDERSSDDQRAWDLSRPPVTERHAFRLVASLALGAVLGASIVILGAAIGAIVAYVLAPVLL